MQLVCGQKESEFHCEKLSTIIFIIIFILSERYAPQELALLSVSDSQCMLKLKTNQTDIALNTAFIVSPYLEMFTSS